MKYLGATEKNLVAQAPSTRDWFAPDGNNTDQVFQLSETSHLVQTVNL
jgi:hypothetical protein